MQQAQRYIVLLTSLLAIFALAGCMHSPVSNTASGSPWGIEVWASDQCPNKDETMTLRATVTNNGSFSQSVLTQDHPVFDLLIHNGAKIERWSDNQPLTPELTHLNLKPGESKKIEMQYVAKQTIFQVEALFYFDPQYSTSATVFIGGNACYSFGP